MSDPAMTDRPKPPNCSRCGKLTAMYVDGVPTCARCYLGDLPKDGEG